MCLLKTPLTNCDRDDVEGVSPNVSLQNTLLTSYDHRKFRRGLVPGRVYRIDHSHTVTDPITEVASAHMQVHGKGDSHSAIVEISNRSVRAPIHGICHSRSVKSAIPRESA